MTDPLDLPPGIREEHVGPEYFQNQQVRPLTDEELDWLNACMKAGLALLGRYNLGAEGGGFALPMLDLAMQAWREDTRADRPDDEHAAKAIGGLFAYYCKQSFKGSLVIVTDPYGTDLGVRFRGPGDISYPIDSVRKRLHEPGAPLADICAGIQQYLKQAGG